MEQKERFRIDYQLNKKELREMSFRMLMCSFFQYKLFILLVIVWLARAIFMTLMEVAIGGSWMSLIFYVTPILIIVLLILLSTYLLNYQNLKKNGFLDSWRLILENGYIKLEKPNVSNSPASSYTKIIKGRSVLLLGQKLSTKMISFIGIPRRAFASDEELNAFVAALRSSTVQEDTVLNEQETNRECDFVLTFEVTTEQWFWIYDEIIQVIGSTLPVRRRKKLVIAGMCAVVAVTMAVTMYVNKFSMMQAMLVSTILIVFFGILIASANFQKPDKKYQKWMEKGFMPTEPIGEWKVGIRTDGCYTLHNDAYFRLSWSDYCRCYETNDTVYFFDKSMKRYLFIPKKFPGGEEEQERFFDYFRQLKMEFTKVNL